MTASERAEQIERSFNVPHPMRRLGAALARADERREVTPFTVRVARTRLDELARKGWHDEDGAIVLLMRGARREVIALAQGRKMADVSEWVADIRHRLNSLTEADLDAMVWTAQENLDLLRRA